MEQKQPTQKKPLLESLKELGRLILISIVSYFLTEGVITTLVGYYFGTHIDTFTKVQITAVLTLVARTVDKYLHISGIAEGGLTRF